MAWKIVIAYALVGIGWLCFSDRFLISIMPDTAVVRLAEIKSWLFVMVTMPILGVVLHVYFRQIRSATRSLEESLRRLKGVSDNLPGGYVYHFFRDPDGTPHFTYVSAGVERVHGISASDALKDARFVMNLIAREQRQAYLDAERQSARNLTEFEMELGARRADGIPQTLHLRSRPEKDANGQVQWYGFVSDVTETRGSEAFRRRWVDAFLHCAHGIGIGSPVSNEIILCNPAFARMLGRTVEEITGSKILSHYPEAEHERIRACLAEVDRLGQIRYEATLLRSDGSNFPVQIDLVTVAGPDGKALYRVATAQDITARKQVEIEVLHRLELQDQLAKIVATVPGMICSFRLRPDGVVSMPFCTRVIQDLYGLNPEDVRDDFTPAYTRLHPDDLKGLQEGIAESARTMSPWQDTWRVLHPAKGELWVEGNSVPELQADGSILWHGFVQDVTERKRAEEKLRKLSRAVEQSPASVVITNLRGDIEYVNPKFCELTGYSLEEVRGKNPRLLKSGGVPPENYRQMWEHITRGEEWRGEFHNRKKNGELYWEVATISPIVDSSGKISHFLAIKQDITELKELEESLRQSEQRLQIAMTAAKMGTWEMDLDSPERLIHWTAQYGELFGRGLPDFPTGQQAFLDCIHPEDRDAVSRSFQRGIEQDVPFGCEFRVHWPDGSMHWHAVMGRAVRAPSGQPTRMVGVGMDITEQKHLESELRQAQKLEAVGQLAGGVAHDFNNILAAILMHLGLLQMNGNLDESTKGALKDLEAAAQRAAGLTRQLLMFSRRSVLAVKPLDLNEVIENLLKMLRRLIGENINLRFEAATNLSLIEADAGMMEQVLMNLVVNARDAMPQGGRISISTASVEFDSRRVDNYPDRRPGRFVCLEVQDTGCGMEPEILKRIFEPFFTTKEAGKGTGLGLATAYGIVAQHKGWVEVDSLPGHGTTFRTFLPTVSPGALPPPEPPKMEPIRRGSETILVVEDEQGVRRIVAQALRLLGYTILEASNGKEAMALWQERGAGVQLVFTDMVMPEGTTGLELIEKLRALRPNLRAIVSSGYSAEISQTGAPSKAGIIYLPKPYETKVLAKVVRECLDMKT
jgi:nitrogen fixation negative regulator NifL